MMPWWWTGEPLRSEEEQALYRDHCDTGICRLREIDIEEWLFAHEQIFAEWEGWA